MGPPDAGPVDAGAVDAGVVDGGTSPDAGSAADAGPYSGEISYLVTHYDFTIDLTSFATTSKVSLQLTGGGNCLTIPYRGGVLDSVSIDGVAAAQVSEDSQQNLHACDGSDGGWASGADVELQTQTTEPLYQEDSLQVGFGQYGDLENNLFTYLVSWVGGCDLHSPCDVRPDQFATYHFTVTHPSGTQVLCPGTVVPGDTTTTCDFEFPGGPTYSTFGIAASPSWQMTDFGMLGGLHVTLYDEPNSGIAAHVDTAAISGFIQFMQDTFGPYPFGTDLRYAVGPTVWWGFEHPGNIVIDDTLAISGAGTYADPLTHVMMHEFAHQWAGDQTTLTDTYDFVWKESMVEYLAYVYEDEHLATGVSAATRALWKSDSVGSKFFAVPGEKPPLANYYGYTYGEGPQVLFLQIEQMYGRAAVLAAIKSLIGHPHTIGVTDLQAALETSTGADLSEYFGAWVYGTGSPAWPTAAVTLTDAGAGQLSVAVSLSTADDKARGTAFAVRLTGADAGEQLDVPFDFGPSGAPQQPQVVAPGFDVAGVQVDPDQESLVFQGSVSGAKPRAVPAARPRVGWFFP